MHRMLYEFSKYQPHMVRSRVQFHYDRCVAWIPLLSTMWTVRHPLSGKPQHALYCYLLIEFPGIWISPSSAMTIWAGSCWISEYNHILSDYFIGWWWSMFLTNILVMAFYPPHTHPPPEALNLYCTFPAVFIPSLYCLYIIFISVFPSFKILYTFCVFTFFVRYLLFPYFYHVFSFC